MLGPGETGSTMSEDEEAESQVTWPFKLRHKVVHIPGTQDIADPLSCLIDGKAEPPQHKHEAEQCV